MTVPSGTLPLEGGCLCRRVRYRLSGPLLSVDYCHCRMCQQATGGAATPWATAVSDGFAWTAGAPRAYPSSAVGRRWFCPDCGTPLAFQDLGEHPTWGVTLGSLDDPAALAPRQHAWIGSRIPWHAIDETLPAFVDEGPESERVRVQ